MSNLLLKEIEDYFNGKYGAGDKPRLGQTQVTFDDHDKACDFLQRLRQIEPVTNDVAVFIDCLTSIQTMTHLHLPKRASRNLFEKHKEAYNCVLCHSATPISDSHVISKCLFKQHCWGYNNVPFAVSGLKASSGEDSLFCAPLLCNKCEQLFSRFEGHEDIIARDLKEKKECTYDWKFVSFVLSLSFRAFFRKSLFGGEELKYYLEAWRSFHPMVSQLRSVFKWMSTNIKSFSEAQPDFTLEECEGIDEFLPLFVIGAQPYASQPIFSDVQILKKDINSAEGGICTFTHTRFLSFAVAWPRFTHGYIIQEDGLLYPDWFGYQRILPNGWRHQKLGLKYGSPNVLNKLVVADSEASESSNHSDKMLRYVENYSRTQALKIATTITLPTRIGCFFFYDPCKLELHINKYQTDIEWKTEKQRAYANFTDMSYWRVVQIGVKNFILFHIFNPRPTAIQIELFEMKGGRLYHHNYGLVEWSQIDKIYGLRDYLLRESRSENLPKELPASWMENIQAPIEANEIGDYFSYFKYQSQMGDTSFKMGEYCLALVCFKRALLALEAIECSNLQMVRYFKLLTYTQLHGAVDKHHMLFGDKFMSYLPDESSTAVDLSCRHCQKQHTSNFPLKRCMACKNVLYCTSNCQRDDWPRHKTECAQLKR